MEVVMSPVSFLTQADLREGEYRSLTRGINTAFLREIKEDHVAFSELLAQCRQRIRPEQAIKSRELATLLGRLRDEIETYFSLEEFYGEYDQAFQTDPGHARTVARLKHQHEQLFTELNGLVERAEQLVYHEIPTSRRREIVADFQSFAETLERHEAAERELISRQVTEETGVGD
jgi:hypothetical protein